MEKRVLLPSASIPYLSMFPSAPPTSQHIQGMFDRLARRYDLFNHLTGLGLASRWRRIALEPVRAGMRILDLGCGTGDLSFGAVQKMDGQGEVTGLDFSKNMLDHARKRAGKIEPRAQALLRWVEKKAEDLPFENSPYDGVISGFVLRNLYENIDAILTGVHRSLKPGGFIRFIDITEPENILVRWVWQFYMNSAVVIYGKLLFGKDYPSFYLTESARRFLRAAHFMKKLESGGFSNVRAKPLMLGMVTLYEAVKPR